MNGKLKVKQIEKPDGKPVDLTGQSTAKATANIDGVAATIRGSLNVASLTDIGVGQYQCNFANVFADSTEMMPFFSALASYRGNCPIRTYSTAKCSVRVSDDSSATAIDVNHVFMHTHGGLA